MAEHLHVTSTINRESIRAHGLDWRRMGEAPGIAGSVRPEQAGVFVCRDEFECEFFVSMNNTGGPVDVWVLDGVTEDELVQSPEGFVYVPRAVPPTAVRLVRTDVSRSPEPEPQVGGPGAYSSRLVVTDDDDATGLS